MNCAELEILLCDYVDGTLTTEQRSTVDSHLSTCAPCRELAADASAAVDFIERAAAVEVPSELVTRIIFHNRPEKSTAPERKGWRRWFGGWLEPVLQPRFAMGMAMTILSFS
ncbi:MAG: zf-HC2 domain-containing protein, partial [Bryobacteraceae bacterium]